MDAYVIMMTVAAALLLVSAVLFIITEFFGKIGKKTSRVKEKALDAVVDCSDGEFRIKIAKHMKDMESTQKELIELLKNQNSLLQAQIENLEHEIYMLSEKQVNQSKSIIKFNKENARQLAISERETLEYVMMELKKAIEDNAGAVRTAGVAEAAPSIELEEVSGEELFEVSDLPGDDEFMIPDLPAPEEIPALAEENDVSELLTEEIPEIPDDLDLSALFEDIAEAAAEEAAPAPAAEEKAEEPAPAADPLAGLGADPNAMMTPEDIAKLLEAMGQ